MAHDGFVTIDEAANLSGLSHWSIRRMLSRARLTRYRSCGRVLVQREELLELVRPKKGNEL